MSVRVAGTVECLLYDEREKEKEGEREREVYIYIKRERGGK